MSLERLEARDGLRPWSFLPPMLFDLDGQIACVKREIAQRERRPCLTADTVLEGLRRVLATLEWLRPPP